MTPADLQSLPVRPPDHRLAYGDDPNQFGELRLPSGAGPHPVVVLIHGGCWKADYATLRDLGPMGDALESEGIATWNIEYRRLGQPGSGWPGTYLDVGRGIDHLRQVAPRYGLDLARVAVVGHSAGGHLAMWAATRHRLSPKSSVYLANPLPLRGVVNLAGTIDMRENISHMEGECHDAVVTTMLGGTPAKVPERSREVSATTMVPLGVQQLLVWGEREQFVPTVLARRHVDAATKAGDRARLIVVPAVGHFELASPQSSAWRTVLDAVRSLVVN
ncbi:MAG TPA: alpha/beta hydrolase [Thermomicrobiales bacterium]|nr:alpha/beta hydrolase [Thermomicrobiales bacterium]